jgi:hypothetical protein
MYSVFLARNVLEGRHLCGLTPAYFVGETL